MDKRVGARKRFRNCQEIYDTAKQHLLRQNSRAVMDGVCCYRARDGKMCAVGCLIPDARYHCGLEGLSVIDDRVAKAAGLRGNKQRCLASALQGVHDCCVVEYWPAQLREVAESFGLKP